MAEDPPASLMEEEVEITSLSDLPDFRGPSRLLKDAYKETKLLKANMKIGNIKKRGIKHAAAQVDTYASTISISLKQQRAEFQRIMQGLPKFESELSELTLLAQEREGGDSMRTVMKKFDLMRRAVVRTGKEAAARVVASETVAEARERAAQGLEEVEEVFESESGALLNLIKTTQLLRRLPRATGGEPCIVLIGMPNVGKSSLVVATSTGNPEVNDYPFTTRRIKVGHVLKDENRYVIMDTPGILARAEDDRNPMEGLTLCAAKHLPSALVFVMDLSGTSGAQSSPLAQLKVRDQIRELFPERPWIDVRSKADLPFAPEVEPSQLPAGILHVSVHEGKNVDKLREVLGATAASMGVAEQGWITE